MKTEEIRHAIKEIIANVTGISADSISDHAALQDELDLDSLSLLEVGVDVDYRFKLGVPEEELQNLRSLDDLVDLVLIRRVELAVA
jgi:acyl carrier protein